MSVRMVLRSTDCISMFENNVPNNFTVQLNKEVDLEGYWVVALTEISIVYQTSSRMSGDIYIFSNICVDSFVGASEKPLLRKVHIGKDGTEGFAKNKKKYFTSTLIFDTPYYIPVRSGLLNQINIYINDAIGNASSFTNEETCVTLHLKKYPFLQ